MDTNGVVAKSTVDSNSSSIQDVNKNEVNDPLQYAREATYTQSSLSRNPATGKQEGGATAAILAWTSKNRWSRALGLHFINTPSNLIKWNFEQLPLLRKLVVSSRHALMKGKNGKYLNPEGRWRLFFTSEVSQKPDIFNVNTSESNVFFKKKENEPF